MTAVLVFPTNSAIAVPTAVVQTAVPAAFFPTAVELNLQIAVLGNRPTADERTLRSEIG